MTKPTESFGTVLRQLRRQARLSQEELASAVAVDFTYISKLENDRVPPPSEETILKLCDVLKADSGELLALSKKVPPEVRDLITSNKAALQFIRSAQAMNLKEEEWQKMIRDLKRLRR